MKSDIRFVAALAALASLLQASGAAADVTPPAGYIYDAQLLASLTQNCVATGPGGTFVGIGKGFVANAGQIVLAKESGDLRLLASGFNSISDCAYDAASDTLYVTDNADNADLDLATGMFGNTGAQTGDTVFAIANASRAAGLSATDIELLPADSIPAAASVAVDGSGAVFVSNAVGAGAGTVLEIGSGPSVSTFASGFDFTGGIAFDPASGDLFVADSLASFENRIQRFDSSGAPVAPVPFAAPSYGFGSVDLAFDGSGELLATGVFAGDVVAFDLGGSASTFASGFTFAGNSSVDPFTGRVELLSSTFTGAAEDKSIHRFVPIDRLEAGTGSADRECLHEWYGVELEGADSVCVDGDACDDDGEVNGRCTFPLGFCVAVADSALPECDADVDIVEASVTAKSDALVTATVNEAVAAALPIGAARCFFSDGYVVPLRSATKAGKAKVRMKAKADDGRTDVDVLRLVCEPS